MKAVEVRKLLKRLEGSGIVIKPALDELDRIETLSDAGEFVERMAQQTVQRIIEGGSERKPVGIMTKHHGRKASTVLYDELHKDKPIRK